MAQSEHSDKKEPTLEELLELAKSTPTLDNKDASVNSVDEFIIAYNIRPIRGEYAYAEQVYWIYHNWCVDNKHTEIPRIKFHIQMKKRFEWYCRQGRDVYRIEKKDFEISQEEYFKMRKFLRNAKDKKTKKRREVSGSKP